MKIYEYIYFLDRMSNAFSTLSYSFPEKKGFKQHTTIITSPTFIDFYLFRLVIGKIF